MRLALLAFAVPALLITAAHAQPAGDLVRPLTLLTLPQAVSPQEYNAAELVADSWKQLGLTVTVRPLPSQQFNQVVWYERQKWDATTWTMVGRTIIFLPDCAHPSHPAPNGPPAGNKPAPPQAPPPAN